MKAHDEEIMNVFYFGTMMQEHLAQKNHCILVDIGGVLCFKEVGFLSVELM